ncbi:MAG: YqgE/AlgH family protein [Bacteroidales bacterium]|nr:YqgE/AlgH family protein [Bacteroidales bacterium]MBD5258328.1 YqgE/AlgH family protein [Barnesiella sp.]
MKDLDKTLFNIDISTMSPREGSLLVAEPFLSDEHFNHAVISLIDYSPEGSSMGIVMNRTSGYTLGQLVEGFADDVDIPVYFGGPMSRNRMFYIHRLGDLFNGAVEIMPGLWIGGDYNQVLQYVRDGYPSDDLIRFFIGYSGWDAGQLESEVREHVWAVTNPLSPEQMLRDSDDTYWHKVVRQMGSQYRGWQMQPMFPAAN